MDEGRRTRIKQLRRSLGVTGAIVAISVGVLLPVVLASSVGIVAIAVGESTVSLILGVLVTTFAAAAIGGGVIATVLLGRRARLARLQSDLLANVTHELRTPLSSIRLHAQTLQQDGVVDDPAALERSLDVIVRETEWLESMIERMLTWRSAEKDRSGQERRPAPLRPAIEHAVATFGRMVDEDEVSLDVDISTDAVVDHDEAEISSVVTNLLVNAYKYTSDDKRIRLVTRRDGGDVVVEVSDNGIGIPAAEHERIFDPFHRVERGNDRATSGAGLGLAIVRHTVRTHRGSVYVQSEEGAGSTFSVHLPVAKEES
jgi:signal transduction histidine kinase